MGDVIQEQRRFAQGWVGGLPETPCGSGSMFENTKQQREWMPPILRKYAIRSIADIGAGDMNWIKRMPMNGISYAPFDLVPRLPEVAAFDLVRQVPPAVDLILCLWVLNHMPFEDCRAAIANLHASGARWLMMTDRPKWHATQPPEILMHPVEQMVLNEKTGDRIILCRLSA